MRNGKGGCCSIRRVGVSFFRGTCLDGRRGLGLVGWREGLEVPSQIRLVDGVVESNNVPSTIDKPERRIGTRET